MGIFSLLSYINKVSLLAFIVTTLIVGYQVYVLKKEKTKKQTPSIPDFKEKINLNEVANFTNLPSFLTKKETKMVNYSKLVFLIISLLTIMVGIFVFVIIKQNNSSREQALVTSSAIISPTPIRKLISPTPKIILSPTLAASLTPELPTPTVTISETSLTPIVSLTIVPTEIILAQAPSTIPTLDPTNAQKITDSAPKVLPETGSLGKGLLIIGVAISTIFFSFWF